MSEEIKQEGNFKMSKPKKPRNLSAQPEVTRVEIVEPVVEAEVTKVIIPNTEEVETEVVEEVIAENTEVLENVMQEITEEVTSTESIEQEVAAHVQEQIKTGKPLPENIEKLVSFMEETGGSIEDYTRLNTDYSSVNSETLLREYYKKSRPHLDPEEIQFIMEDTFGYDEEIDDERDIRKKKLAFKEEVAKARNFLDDLKNKYYEEIKLRPGVSKEQQEAFDFFNRYKKDEEQNAAKHARFKQNTKNLFTNDFKGFEYSVGDKRFRYSVQNQEQIAEKQSDISNFLGKFLDKEGNIADTSGYHKALYTAMNADRIAQHFYEQGKADAVKEVITSSKNPSATQPRQAPGDVFVNGLKVKAISGFDSSKLRIQTKKF
jgi:hypothetical protein